MLCYAGLWLATCSPSLLGRLTGAVLWVATGSAPSWRRCGRSSSGFGSLEGKSEKFENGSSSRKSECGLAVVTVIAVVAVVSLIDDFKEVCKVYSPPGGAREQTDEH